jgi:NhaP-type Na+/H+ or K+/H+ antiporter
MAFSPFEVNVPHLAYAFLGGFVVFFGLFSLLIKERLYIGEAVVSVVVGISIGESRRTSLLPRRTIP